MSVEKVNKKYLTTIQASAFCKEPECLESNSAEMDGKKYFLEGDLNIEIFQMNSLVLARLQSEEGYLAKTCCLHHAMNGHGGKSHNTFLLKQDEDIIGDLSVMNALAECALHDTFLLSQIQLLCKEA